MTVPGGVQVVIGSSDCVMDLDVIFTPAPISVKLSQLKAQSLVTEYNAS